jgi:FlaG/FlaF family flagellin (archaellin)
MATFLFVAATVALLAGLVSLVAGHVPRTTGHQQAAAQLLRHAHGADGGMNRREHAR